MLPMCCECVVTPSPSTAAVIQVYCPVLYEIFPWLLGGLNFRSSVSEKKKQGRGLGNSYSQEKPGDGSGNAGRRSVQTSGSRQEEMRPCRAGGIEASVDRRWEEAEAGTCL